MLDDAMVAKVTLTITSNRQRQKTSSLLWEFSSFDNSNLALWVRQGYSGKFRVLPHLTSPPWAYLSCKTTYDSSCCVHEYLLWQVDRLQLKFLSNEHTSLVPQVICTNPTYERYDPHDGALP